MTIRERTSKMRGFISTMAGFFAGALSASLITWPTLPKAVLVIAVTSIVIVLLRMLLPKPTH